jgi:hypothetical protein
MDSGVERNETKFVQLNCVQGTAMAGLVASLGSAMKVHPQHTDMRTNAWLNSRLDGDG